jgi:hypothetical protein
MVRNYGDMPGNDDIPRGGGSLVLGHVRWSLDGQGLGMDRRWKSRNTGTTASRESPPIPHSIVPLPHNVNNLRLVVDELHHQYSHPASTAEHDGYVPLRICYPDYLLICHWVPILYIID